ncbi:MAG: PCMD domain-containing protein [Candidatus Cryptobacteroides sp.]
MKTRIFILAVFTLLFSSCLFENDMSYPRYEADIKEFEVEGQKSVKIDAAARTVSIVLNETVDIKALKIEKITVSEKATVGTELPEKVDLSKPLKIIVKTWYEYEWTVTAEQPIERYINVENQQGEAEINVEDKFAIVYVSRSQDISKVVFTGMKLEPEGSEVQATRGFSTETGKEETVLCTFPMELGCVMLRQFYINWKGEIITWNVKVLTREDSMEIKSVNAWSRHAQVRATFSGDVPMMEYRKVSDAEWKTVTDATIAGVGISADLKYLEPGCAYQVRLTVGEESTPATDFVTEEEIQPSNFNFDSWWLSGKVWYPYSEGSTNKVWDSANPATAGFIGSSTTPDGSVVAVSGTGKNAAHMISRNAVIAFAAGNIYTGTFGKIDGVGAILDWGYPFTSRPVALKGYYKYSPRQISKARDPYTSLIGSMDKCQIQILLTDWEEPFTIKTSQGVFVDFENDKHIIAYAKMESDVATDTLTQDAENGYVSFRLPLEYRDNTRKPKYIVVTCCASYLGDYFTGGEGSEMYVDEFELEYE